MASVQVIKPDFLAEQMELNMTPFFAARDAMLTIFPPLSSIVGSITLVSSMGTCRFSVSMDETSGELLVT